MFFFWLSRSINAARESRRNRPQKSRQAALCLEMLESRTLLATNIVMQSVVADGQTGLNLTYQIKQGTAPAFAISFYRSSDAVLGAGDVMLGTVSVNGLAARTVGVHNRGLTIGLGGVTLPGAGKAEVEADYFLLAVADSFNVVAETRESDNSAVLTGAYHVAGGDVYVHGQAGIDTVVISPTQDAGGSRAVSVELGAGLKPLAFAASDVAELRIRTHEGADSVDGTTIDKVLHVWGGADGDTLIGGVAGDFLYGGAGDDTIKGHVSSAILGPQLPPPGDFAFLATGSGLGEKGGQTFNFSDFDFTAFDTMGWEPVSVQLSLNAIPSPDPRINPPKLAPGESLKFDAKLSSLKDGIAVWTGFTRFTHEDAAGSSVTETLATRFTLTATSADPSNPRIVLADTSTSQGFPGPVGALVPVTPATAKFQVKMIMEANFNGSWRPAVELFNAQSSDHTVVAWTSLQAGFFYSQRFDDKDVLSGGPGTNTIDGSHGDDLVVESGNVNMTLSGNTAASTLTGTGTDILSSVEMARLTGGPGNNILDASAFSGPVTLNGGAGNDTLRGGSGDDVFSGGAGNDSINGGGGNDRLVESGNFNYRLTDAMLRTTSLTGILLGVDTLLNIMQASLTGGAGNNKLDATGFAGPVTLNGGGGDDWLIGGSGDDSIFGGGGNDRLDGGAGSDTIDGGPGQDIALRGEVDINIP